MNGIIPSESTGIWKNKQQNMSSTDIRSLPFYYIFMCYKPGLTSTQTVAYVHQLRVIWTFMCHFNISHLQYSWYKPVAKKCQWYKRHQLNENKRLKFHMLHCSWSTCERERDTEIGMIQSLHSLLFYPFPVYFMTLSVNYTSFSRR